MIDGFQKGVLRSPPMLEAHPLEGDSTTRSRTSNAVFNWERRMKPNDRHWLINLCVVEVGIACFAMIVGFPQAGVFMMAMAAHSAHLGTKP